MISSNNLHQNQEELVSQYQNRYFSFYNWCRNYWIFHSFLPTNSVRQSVSHSTNIKGHYKFVWVFQGEYRPINKKKTKTLGNLRTWSMPRHQTVDNDIARSYRGLACHRPSSPGTHTQSNDWDFFSKVHDRWTNPRKGFIKTNSSGVTEDFPLHYSKLSMINYWSPFRNDE